MVTEAQRKATAKYKKANMKQIGFLLHRSTDADILEALEALPKGEKNGFIKRAIRHYLKHLDGIGS